MFQTGFLVKNQNEVANSVDPDEMAHYEPSHHDLHCLQKKIKNKKINKKNNNNVLVYRAERIKGKNLRLFLEK